MNITKVKKVEYGHLVFFEHNGLYMYYHLEGSFISEFSKELKDFMTTFFNNSEISFNEVMNDKDIKETLESYEFLKVAQNE